MSNKFLIIPYYFFTSGSREEESKIKSEMGKFLSCNIFSNSDPTAPDEPKIATFKDLLGNSEELAKIIKNYGNNKKYVSYFIKKDNFRVKHLM